MTTINEMIYNALRTKKDKTPKYYDVLIKLGYKLESDHGWSAQGYWMVENIVISKDRNGKVALFNPSFYIATGKENIKKVDYESYIAAQRKKREKKSDNCCESNVDAYKRLKRNANNTWSIKYHEGKIEDIHEQIEKLNKDAEYHKRSLEDSKKRHEECVREFNNFRIAHNLAN